ncbi:MAG: DUF3570 domain-containing protein [Limisphaerales bacterium]
MITIGFLAEATLRPSLVAKGELVYDAISGATPTGGPPLPGTDQVPLAEMDDIRRAGVFELNQKIGPNTFSPQFSYSDESDYESIGLALNYSLELNQKNTTLLAGVARNFDRIRPGHSFLLETRQKDTLDLMVGVSQLLGPTTVLNANFTYGFSEGYLADPYKGVRFEYYPFFETLFPENRPDSRERQIGFLSLTQFISPANAAIEASYRISHDSFGIVSHTGMLEWRQKVGTMFALTPFGRYYQQSAADFYGISFPGDPSLSMDDVPTYYSSDYRLSAFTSWTYGVKATVTFAETLALEAGFKRYEMTGDDDITSASAYPVANIFTLGLTLWF